MPTTLTSHDFAVAFYYIMGRRTRLIDAFVVSYVLHHTQLRTIKKHTMKASFVILALIQGLALATPARPKYDESLKELLDDSATQPFNSKMLDAEQRAASGSPAELQEMKRAHQRQVLPGECFGATKQIQPYCDSIYHTCGRIHLSGPDFVGTWKSDAQLKRFEHCVNVRLKHGLESQ